MKKKIGKRQILVLLLFLIIIMPLYLFTVMIGSHVFLGIILTFIWLPIKIFLHEFGHAVVLRVIEGKSCICFRKFIEKKVWRISFLKIDIYFVNEKGYGMTALSVSDFINLSILEVQVASLAGLIADILLFIVAVIIAIKYNILTLLMMPLLYALIVVIEFAFCSYGNDFWIFKHPEEFQTEIKGVLNGTITDEKIIENYEHRVYSKLRTKI